MPEVRSFRILSLRANELTNVDANNVSWSTNETAFADFAAIVVVIFVLVVGVAMVSCYETLMWIE